MTDPDPTDQAEPMPEAVERHAPRIARLEAARIALRDLAERNVWWALIFAGAAGIVGMRQREALDDLDAELAGAPPHRGLFATFAQGFRNGWRRRSSPPRRAELAELFPLDLPGEQLRVLTADEVDQLDPAALHEAVRRANGAYGQVLDRPDRGTVPTNGCRSCGALDGHVIGAPCDLDPDEAELLDQATLGAAAAVGASDDEIALARKLNEQLGPEYFARALAAADDSEVDPLLGPDDDGPVELDPLDAAQALAGVALATSMVLPDRDGQADTLDEGQADDVDEGEAPPP